MIEVSMLTHEEIKKSLSAYCGGELPSAERAWVDEHLSSCPSCRSELADLKTTLRIIRNTPAVESPTWLTSRIMANIVEQPVTRNSWLQRLFFPLHTKLPLEILALLIISVTGYYLTQDSDSGLKKAIPQLQQKQSALPQSAPTPVKEKADTVPAPAADAPKAEFHTNIAEKKQTVSSTTTQNSAVSDKTTEPEANSANIHDRSESGAAKMKKAAPAREGQALESSAPPSAGNGFAPAPAVDQPRIRISLIMGLDTLSAKTVRQAVNRSGGTVLPSEATRADRQLSARIPVTKLDELFSQLEKQARIVERPVVDKTVETVVVDILW
jgi:hypothetical protein